MTRQCERCGEPFSGGPPLKRFCSEKCRHKAGRKPSLPGSVNPLRICLQCGGTFTVGHGTKIYCGNSCRRQAAEDARIRRQLSYRIPRHGDDPMGADRTSKMAGFLELLQASGQRHT
jgi:predicted nucleic acid-binding Zn ribbon protein